jgi:hypothetical protein
MVSQPGRGGESPMELLEGMNNKIKMVSHRSLGFRTVKNFTAAIYHCCAHLPLLEKC